MSNIDKQALNQEKIEWLNKLADMEYCKSNPGHWLMSLKDTNMLAKLALRSVALLDELEAKDKAWAAQDDHINQQADRIESLEKKNGDLGRALGAAEKRIAELKELLQWSHDTLLEINPNNYTHDDVCEVNAASVEVILGIAPTLGEMHGHTKEWWDSRAAGTAKGE